ncbi:hypothetical protein JQ554_23395 [Bradyrhizobium diazoefficiens]|nr:hypothetical protein [Bradyrhizobium diazoefficiens]MBR0966999.1 hypothetical protein [Bradyrhizobium diazoefficiens]MBR0979123.1 hypothetical protein [Bradyrhizobium diazoefficiens]MBR1009982.1 hypothetical protein [Bradyrhizobium diazoefficiens]MBR1016560.1 hypothetical protein [Bradyrhizobium diazoefficiens]MBR1053820.1 hypothetical protein [Bradyrhizobium diazoefficiens]
MSTIDLNLSRISKLIIDRDQAGPDAVLARRQAFTVTLCCGDDVADSYTLQLAVLTAASIACRCFPGAVRVAHSAALAEAPLLVWPWLHRKFSQALAEILGPTAPAGYDVGHAIIFGNAAVPKRALRVTFDGWIAKVGPSDAVERLPEREYFAATGVLAASLALSELFVAFAGISLQATRRTVALSLWRPELDIGDPDALGIPVEYLPRDLWVLGLGHLGNAYLWTLAGLPYSDPKEVEFALLDFDVIEKENIETGVIFTTEYENRFKTRACDAWLTRRQFRTRLVERRFDTTFRLQAKEPALALCGFDSNSARRDLPQANFRRVVDAGLGGMANNFDTISLHTWPNPRPPDELWPDPSPDDVAELAAYHERMAQENPGYRELGGDDCGRRDLAGKSVAVPFVGTSAASLAIAETVRLLHDGPSYFDIRLGLGDPGKRSVRRQGTYTAADAAGITYTRADERRIARI